MLDDDPQQIENEINELRAKKGKLLKELRRFKTESGMKLEEIARFQEKKNALGREARERKRRQDKLESELQNKLGQAKQVTNEIASPGRDNHDYNEEREKLKEKFGSLVEKNLNGPLGKFIREYLEDAYATEKKEEQEEDPEKMYARSTIVNTIMICLEEEPATRIEDIEMTEEGPLLSGDQTTIQYVTTFRVAPNTRNYDLIRAACAFWGRRIEDYECVDERSEHFDTRKPPEGAKNVVGEAPKLEKFWRQRRNEYNQLMIVMKRKKKDQLQEIQPKKDEAIDVAEDEEEQSNQNGTYQSYATLLPKLKPYININRTQVEERDKNLDKINHPKSFGENHCCIVLVLTVIFVLMMMSLITQKNMLVEFYTVDNIKKLTYVADLSTVNSPESLLDQLLVLANFFPYDAETLPYLESGSSAIRLYKPIMIRQYRVQERPCELDIGLKCYYDYYDTVSREISSFTAGGAQHNFILQRGEKKMDASIRGTFGNYDIEAYETTYDASALTMGQYMKEICFLFINSQATEELCSEVLEEWLTEEELDEISPQLDGYRSKYVDLNTRAIRISMYLYDISGNSFIHVEPIIEFTPIGTMIAYIPRFPIFKPNFKEQAPVPNSLINVFITIFATFLLLFVLYTLFTSGNGGINLSYFMTLQGFLNTAVVLMCYIIHNMMDKVNGIEVTQQDLLTDSYFSSVNQITDLYESVFILKSVVVGLLVIRLALISKLNTRMEIIVSALQNSIPHILLMTICIAPIALTLAFLATSVMGPHNPTFNSFGKSFAIIMVLFSGNQGDILDSYEPVECLLTVIGFFFLYFLLFSVFPAINVENYRQTLLDYGKGYHAKYTWKPKDYKEWALSWIPNKIKNAQNQLAGGMLDLQKGMMDLGKNLNVDAAKGLLKKAGNVANLKNIANIGKKNEKKSKKKTKGQEEEQEKGKEKDIKI